MLAFSPLLMRLRDYTLCHYMVLMVIVATLMYSETLQAHTPPQQPLNSWEYRWGDSPVDVNGLPLWLRSDVSGWQSVTSPSNPPGRGDHEHLWLRTTLPPGEWNDPVLYITSINLIGQAYLNDQLIYQYGEFDEQGRGAFAGWPWHIINLPSDANGQVLTFRLYSYYTSIGLWGEVKIMERLDVLKQVIHESTQDLAVSALVLVLALLATIFMVIGPERRGFGAIALFAYASGLMLIAETPARQLIAEGALAWDTLRAGSYYMLPVALALLLSHWLEGAPKRWLTRLWKLHLAYFVFAIGLVQMGAISLSTTFPVFDVLLAVSLPIMVVLALLRFPKLTLEQRLLVLSFAFFAPLLVADMLVAHGFISWRPISLSYGILAFTLANAAISLCHYRRIQLALSTANETLEYQVAARTAELDRLVQELEGLSFEDYLTGLNNRRHFNLLFEQACHEAQQRKSELSLLMLDIDYFKHVNDHFGHAAGDAVLVDIASLLKQHFGDLGVICRVGGEEFVVLLSTTPLTVADNYANALLTSVSQQSFYYHGESLGRITLSCGVASYPDHTHDPQQLLKLADEALYNAKRSGRNRCAMWAESVETQGFTLGNEQPE